MAKKLVSVPMHNGACTRFALLFPDLSQLVRRWGSSSSHTSRLPAKKGRLHEKSYPSNDEDQSFPSTRNAHESNGERYSGPPMRGKKRGKIRPAGRISREV